MTSKKRRGPWPALLLVLGVAVLVGSQVRRNLPVEGLRAKYADAASGFATIDGMTVHYRDQGQGPALVLLHGTGSSLHTWDGWAAALRDSFRVVRMGLPGFGHTGPNRTNAHAVWDYAAFLDAFRDSLSIRRAAFASRCSFSGAKKMPGRRWHWRRNSSAISLTPG